MAQLRLEWHPRTTTSYSATVKGEQGFEVRAAQYWGGPAPWGMNCDPDGPSSIRISEERFLTALDAQHAAERLLEAAGLLPKEEGTMTTNKKKKFHTIEWKDAHEHGGEAKSFLFVNGVQAVHGGNAEEGRVRDNGIRVIRDGDYHAKGECVFDNKNVSVDIHRATREDAKQACLEHLKSVGALDFEPKKLSSEEKALAALEAKKLAIQAAIVKKKYGVLRLGIIKHNSGRTKPKPPKEPKLSKRLAAIQAVLDKNGFGCQYPAAVELSSAIVGYKFTAKKDGGSERRLKKFDVVVPLKNMNGHDYVLNTPVMVKTIDGIALRSTGGSGNHLPFLEKHFTAGEIRYATAAEVKAFLNRATPEFWTAAAAL